MKNLLLSLLVSSLFFACSFKNQLTYVNNVKGDNVTKINSSKKNYIDIGDILKIDVRTALSEVSIPYNNISSLKNNTYEAWLSMYLMRIT